jgi:hypothetical protein
MIGYFKQKTSSKFLSKDEYEKLLVPSENNSVEYYSFFEKGLYNGIIMKYMSGVPDKEMNRDAHTEMDNMEM